MSAMGRKRTLTIDPCTALAITKSRARVGVFVIIPDKAVRVGCWKGADFQGLTRPNQRSKLYRRQVLFFVVGGSALAFLNHVDLKITDTANWTW